MKKLILSIVVFLFQGCNTTDPLMEPIINISAEDVSCIEAWLKVTITNINLPVDGVVFINNKPFKKIKLISSDTLVYIDSLKPSTTYEFQLLLNTMMSNKVNAVTMDTTSHNFTWQTFTFGEGTSSSLFDVAIIDENNIWVVGEIYMNDSLGNPDPHAYNAVHWNGNEWQLKRIYFPTVCSSTNLSPFPTKAIFSFSDGQIWICSSGDKIAIIKDGIQIDKFCLPSNVSMSINKIWGTSSKDLYIVGISGNIAHYNGSEWTKIESGTELRFHDLYGNKEKIYCIAAERFSGINSELYEIKNSRALLVDGTNLGLSSVTVYPIGKKLYVFGYYRLVFTEGKTGWEQISEPVNFDGYSKIRGSGYNDIVAVGSFGKIYHYNGISWKMRRIGEDINNLIGFSSVAVKNNIICAVGKIENSAAIVIGRR